METNHSEHIHIMTIGVRLGKALLQATTGTTALVAGVNLHQYRLTQRDKEPGFAEQRLIQSNEHLYFANTTLKELAGVTLGMLTHHTLATKPKRFKDPNRLLLDKELLARLDAGKIDHYNYHSISQVNVELDRQGIPLSKGPLIAILNAADTMHEHRSKILTKPGEYLDRLWTCELNIAKEFGSEGSTVGLIAHTAKAAAETITCAILQAIQSSVEAHDKKLMRFKGDASGDFKQSYQHDKAAYEGDTDEPATGPKGP